MEHIVRESIYPQVARPRPKPRLSPLVQIVFSVLVGFSVAIAGVRAVSQAQHGPVLLDPFSAYADIFPGQPESAVKTRPFSCEKYYHEYPDAETDCTFAPPEGIFSHIDVAISGGTIFQLTFIIRDNTLNIGDLARLLGMPAMRRFYRTTYFILPTNLVRADTIDHGEQFSLFLPVWSITFMKLT